MRGRPAQALCLCMIVRNEAATIERCLTSVRPLISRWVICDTGSTDDTAERITSALDGIPGTLHHRPWVDFGANRSELMELARGEGDYLFLLDADMTVRQMSPLPLLRADAYTVRFDGSLDYVNVRLVKSDQPWRYVGSTHEYLTSDQPVATSELAALRIVHHADGGSRGDKLERDLKLLGKDLAERPDDERTVFYLAQTHRDLGEVDEAIAHYERRAGMGGYAEEAFYAAYQVGVLRARNDPARGIGHLLAAWQSRPTRAEPLHDAAVVAREQGWWQLARMLSERGKELPPPGDDLFVHTWMYEWGLLLEYSLAAWWTGDPASALAATEQLLAVPDLPPEVVERARGNRDLIAPVRALADLAPDVRFGEIRLDVEPAWPQFNPTIAATKHGFRMIVRTASYEIHDGRYHLLDGDRIQTVNYLVTLDSELAVRHVRPLRDLDADAGPPRHDGEILGYEDARLVKHEGRWWATATVRDRSPDQRAQIALLGLQGGSIESVRILDAGRGAEHEKNWMPFLAEAGLHLVYSVDPTVVYRLEPETGALDLVVDEPGPPGTADLRGGSAGVPFDDGHLFVVHEVRHGARGRDYVHRLVLLGSDFRVAALSERFSFFGPGIEFCAGLAPHPDGFVFSFGRDDRSAWLALVGRDAIRRMLGRDRAT